MAPPKEAPKEQQQLLTDPPPATPNPQTNGAPTEPATAEPPVQTEAIEKAAPSAPPAAPASRTTQVLIGQHGAELRDLESLWRFAGMVALSGLAPKGMEKREAIAVAIQLGLELGLPPMAALQNIAVINGRPGIYGDAALALVLASGLCEYHRETYKGEGDARAAVCTTKRKDAPEPLTTTFSVADARKAKLWGKDGPWTLYPDRMLRFRARGFNLRDNFADVLKGFRTVEEVTDISDLEEVPETAPIEMPRRASESAATETTAVASS